jgi:hypothetical protein
MGRSTPVPSARTSRKPYDRPAPSHVSLPPRGSLVYELNKIIAEDRAKPRYDINLTDVDRPKVAVMLTLEELKAREGSQLHVGTPCLRCGLIVPSFGFGWYTPGDEDPRDLDVIHRECKACWRYSASNPRFDCEDDTTRLPPVSPALLCSLIINVLSLSFSVRLPRRFNGLRSRLDRL